MKNLKSILDKFVNKDDLRICTPFAQGDYVYATDSHILLRVNRSLLDGEYPVTDYSPNCARVFDALDTASDGRIVTWNNVRKAYAQVPLVDKRCPECEGDRYVDWEYEDRDGHVYTRTADCPVCKGEGRIQGEKVPDFNYLFQVDKGFVFARLFVKLMEACLILGVNAVSLYPANDGGNIYFRIANGVDGVMASCSHIKDKKRSTKLRLLESKKGGDK